jgi:hypothetical protein
MEKKPSQRATPKTRSLAVDFAETGFATVLFFNRFGIERGDGYFLIHFGFVTKGGDVLASYSTIMTDSFIERNRENWLKYLGSIGEPPERPIDLAWRPPTSPRRLIEVTNASRLARNGPDAEIRCYCISTGAAIDRSQSSADATKPLQSQPLALLQSPLEQHQLLLLALLKAK